jgi:hypothetical protein
LWGAAAHAEPLRLRLSLQPVYAIAFADERDPSGGGVGADLALGLTPALSLRITGFVTFHHAAGRPLPPVDGAPATGPDGTLSAFGAFAGVTYELPVMRIVPAFDVGLGAVGLRGDARFGNGPQATLLETPITAFAVELGFGVDWLITRRWALGAVVRYHALLTELERAPSFLYVGPRLSLTLPL